MVSAVPRPQAMARMLTPMPAGDQPSTRMAKTAEAEGPEVMPMMSGLASWLRSIVWEVVPAIPKAIPASSPMIARGSRISPTSKEAPGTMSPESTASTSSGLYQVSPTRIMATHSAAAVRARAMVTAAKRRVRRRRPAMEKPGCRDWILGALVVASVMLGVLIARAPSFHGRS